jgi:diguanylate cyclase (GGDEF)-like protein
VVLVVGAVMCVVMGAATFRAYERRAGDLTTAVDRLREKADLIAQRQSDLFRQTDGLVDILASGTNPAAFGSPTLCSTTLGRYLERNPGLDNLAIAQPDGEVVCDAQSAKKANIGDRGYFQAALATSRTIVGAPLASRMTGHWVLPFAHAMRGPNGTPQGVLIATLNLETLGDVVATASQFRNIRFGLVDHHGLVLAHYPDRQHMPGKSIADRPFFKKIIAQNGTGTDEQTGPDGELQVYAFARLAETTAGPVYLWVAMHKNLITAAANQQFAWAVAIALAICAASFACIWLAGERYFIRPLRAIANAARHLSAGDYQARTGVPHGSDELGTLAAVFDRMAMALTSESVTLKLNRALKVLSNCGNILVRAKNEREVLDGICRNIVETGNYPFAWIGYPEESAQRSIRPVSSYSNTENRLEHTRLSWSESDDSNGPVVRAIRTGLTQVEQDAKGPGREQGFRAMVALPLQDRGSVFGVLCIHAFETHAFKHEEVELLEQLTEDLAFGVLAHRSKVQQQRSEDLAERLARYDAITDLPNRGELIAHLTRAIERARQESTGIELMVASIDQWNDIGDALGMAGTDHLLRQLKTRLFAQVGQVHFLARVASDAFAIVVPAAIEHSTKLALELNASFEEPLEYAGIPVDVRFTAGIASFPEHAQEPDALLRRAGIAVRQARAAGQPHAVYSGAAESESPERLVLLSDLRKAIRDDALTLHYQPKVAASQHNVCSAEALVRWNDDVRGFVSPGAFIPLAEHTGLIKPLTYWVLGAALRQAAQWQHMDPPIRIAVNVSPNNLRDPAFFEQLITMPRQIGARLDLLDLEITETALMEDPAKSLDVLARIADLGVRIFIDDFGTGYSSLAYLATLPIHALKIDRSFVIHMDQPRYRAIVESTISMAHSLGLKVVAEGVELADIADALTARGCDEIQGYLYSKPLAADDFVKWCETFNRRSTP